MESAHTVGSGGPEIELLILAGAMLVLGVVFFFQKSVKPIVSLVLVLGAFAVSGGAFVFTSDDSTEAATIQATISIVDPIEGATVPANESFPVEIDLQGGTLTAENRADDATEGHLHVYVDGELISMPATDAPEVELEPGPHEITIEFTQADHRSYEPRILDSVEVTAEHDRAGGQG